MVIGDVKLEAKATECVIEDAVAPLDEYEVVHGNKWFDPSWKHRATVINKAGKTIVGAEINWDELYMNRRIKPTTVYIECDSD